MLRRVPHQCRLTDALINARRWRRDGWYASGMPADLLSRITHDVAGMGGRPCIRGMRVTVGTILGLMASGKTAEEILALYPYLEGEDIQAALAYAAWRSEEIEVPLKAS